LDLRPPRVLGCLPGGHDATPQPRVGTQRGRAKPQGLGCVRRIRSRGRTLLPKLHRRDLAFLRCMHRGHARAEAPRLRRAPRSRDRRSSLPEGTQRQPSHRVLWLARAHVQSARLVDLFTRSRPILPRPVMRGDTACMSAPEQAERILAAHPALEPVSLDGTRAWIASADRPSLEAAEPTRTVRLLPGFDQYLIGSTSSVHPLLSDPGCATGSTGRRGGSRRSSPSAVGSRASGRMSGRAPGSR